MILVTPRHKVLVLGDDTRSFLSVIRSLGRGGLDVHVAWHQGGPPLRSRYISQAHDLPLPSSLDHAWKDALIELMVRERFDLIIPCSDPVLVPLQRNRADFEPHGRIYLLDDRSFEVFSDKLQTNELARSVGVRVPREVVVAGPGDTHSVTSVLHLPVVLKPPTSFDASKPDVKRMVRKAYTWDEFHTHLASMSQLGPVAVQENFIGEGVGVELLLDQGEPLLAFQHVRLHEPLHGGGSSYRKSVTLTPALFDASLKLMKALKYTGVAMVEFKVEPKTGDWVLIEVNCRFWGSLPLAVASGADFPLALVQFLVDGKREFPKSYRKGICSRNLNSDFTWQISNLRADRSDPTLSTRPLLTVLGETISNVVLLRERWDTLTLDDPRPGFAELAEVVGRIRRGIGRKLARKFIQFGMVRRHFYKRAHKALRGEGSFLFICKGNICRSPFAEELACQKLGGNRSIMSAGYYPRPGRSSPDNAITAASRWGVDLTGHRSQLLTKQMVHAAAAVFVFDAENADRVSNEFQCPRGRIHFVGALNPSGPLYIEDPWGGTIEQFQDCYGLISKAFESVESV